MEIEKIILSELNSFVQNIEFGSDLNDSTDKRNDFWENAILFE